MYKTHEMKRRCDDVVDDCNNNNDDHDEDDGGVAVATTTTMIIYLRNDLDSDLCVARASSLIVCNAHVYMHRIHFTHMRLS